MTNYPRSLIGKLKAASTEAEALNKNVLVVSLEVAEFLIRQHEADTMGDASTRKGEETYSDKDKFATSPTNSSEISVKSKEALEEIVKQCRSTPSHCSHTILSMTLGVIEAIAEEALAHKGLSLPVRESSEDWPNLRTETQEVLTWAHNVMMCCDNLPEDNKANYPVEVFYLRMLCEKVKAYEKGQSDRLLNFFRKKTNQIEG